MKNFKKVMSIFIITLIMMTSMTIVASAEETSYNITFRVEGPDTNICYTTLSVPYEGNLTAAQALVYLDKKSEEVELIGAESGYITSVNDISAAKFGGWDGWYFAVNDESAAVGISDFILKDNDNLVLYYGGYPCQIPVADTSKLDSEGIISFTSMDTEYDENFNATVVENNVTDAEVTVNGDKYTTDENGEIKIPVDKLTNELSVQIEKKDASGAPAVLRFAPDYTVSYNGTLVENTTNDTETDTEASTESDTDTTSNDETSSNTTSKVTSTTTTATAATYARATAVDTTETGDGRIYLAVGVFAVAIVIFIVMLLSKKKSDKQINRTKL